MTDDGEPQDYHVRFVGEGDLPDDQPWVFIRHDGALWLAIKRESVTPDTLEDCWAAFRRMAD